MSLITDAKQLAAFDKLEASTIKDGHTMYFEQGRICIDTHIELKDDDKDYCIVTVYKFNEKRNECAGFFNFSYARESFIEQEDYTQIERFVFDVTDNDDIKAVYAKHAELNAQYSDLLSY